MTSAELMPCSSLQATLVDKLLPLLTAGGASPAVVTEQLRQWQQALQEQMEMERQMKAKQPAVWRCAVCGSSLEVRLPGGALHRELRGGGCLSQMCCCQMLLKLSCAYTVYAFGTFYSQSPAVPPLGIVSHCSRWTLSAEAGQRQYSQCVYACVHNTMRLLWCQQTRCQRACQISVIELLSWA